MCAHMRTEVNVEFLSQLYLTLFYEAESLIEPRPYPVRPD